MSQRLLTCTERRGSRSPQSPGRPVAWSMACGSPRRQACTKFAGSPRLLQLFPASGHVQTKPAECAAQSLQFSTQAIACRLLPGAHWALLYVIATTFVLSFIMFESGGSFSNEGRHTLWTLLCALMVFVLTVRTAQDT